MRLDAALHALSSAVEAQQYIRLSFRASCDLSESAAQDSNH